jgi:hypothetical protein
MPGRGDLRRSRATRSVVVGRGTGASLRAYHARRREEKAKEVERAAEEKERLGAFDRGARAAGLSDRTFPETSSQGWILPSSPDDRLYAEQWDAIRCSPTAEARLLGERTLFSNDFWAYLRWCSPLRNYQIADPDHPRCGKLWVEEPYCFDLAREYQHVKKVGLDTRVFLWWNPPRGHFKTTIIAVEGSLWDIVCDPATVIVMIVFKEEKVGFTTFNGVRQAIETNLSLRRHWPDIFDPSLFRRHTKSELTVRRSEGSREPTVSVHALSVAPTGFHLPHGGRIVVSDVEVLQSIQTEAAARKTAAEVAKLSPLSGHGKVRFHIEGTVWDGNGPHRRLERDGIIVRHVWPRRAPLPWDASTYSCWIDADKEEPQLLSRQALVDIKAKTDDYNFSCNYLGTPSARGRQKFHAANLRFYDRPPAEEAAGKNVYLVFECASGKGHGDYAPIWVLGFGSDQNVYALDLWREKEDIEGVADILFPLVRTWRPRRVLYEPALIQDSHGAYLRAAMELRSFRFELVALPEVRTPKVDRILTLGPLFRDRRFYLPRAGFGHGSSSPPTARDTLVQFREDEYEIWSPEPKSTMYDDMLDVLSTITFSATKGFFEFPEAPGDWESLTGRRRGNAEASSSSPMSW